MARDLVHSHRAATGTWQGHLCTATEWQSSKAAEWQSGSGKAGHLIGVIVNVKMKGLGFVEQEMIISYRIVGFPKGSKDCLDDKVDDMTEAANMLIR
jgi:hypothetical protein